MPLTRTFYVATDCGLAVSTDNGATFTTTPIDPANPMLFSVLVVNRTTGVAADSKPHVVSEQRPVDAVARRTGRGRHLHAACVRLAVLGGDNIFFHAGRDRRLWVSTTSGGAWRLMPTYLRHTPQGCGNREPFVRAGAGSMATDPPRRVLRRRV